MMKRKWDDGYPASLAYHLDVPLSKQDEIRQQHQLHQQQNSYFSRYCTSSLPGFSWARFAGALYYCKEEAALVAAKRYIKREEGMLYVFTELMLLTSYNQLKCLHKHYTFTLHILRDFIASHVNRTSLIILVNYI